MASDFSSPEWIRNQLEALGRTYEYVENDPWEQRRDITDYDRASYALGFHQHRQHIPVMVEMLSTGNEGVRLYIASAFADLGAINDATVVEALLGRLNDSSPQVKSVSLRALCKKYDARIVPALRQHKAAHPELAEDSDAAIEKVNLLRQEVEKYPSVEDYEIAYTRAVIASIHELLSELRGE